jgi:hypothetical protein
LDFFSEALPPGRKGEIDLSKVRVYYLPQDPRRYFLEVEDTGDTGKADTGKAV